MNHKKEKKEKRITKRKEKEDNIEYLFNTIIPNRNSKEPKRSRKSKKIRYT